MPEKTVDRDRWKALLHEGKKVILVGPSGRWTVIEANTEKHAASIVRELCLWAKGEHDDAEYLKLCRASD